jgi:hypothetical protein
MPAMSLRPSRLAVSLLVLGLVSAFAFGQPQSRNGRRGGPDFGRGRQPAFREPFSGRDRLPDSFPAPDGGRRDPLPGHPPTFLPRSAGQGRGLPTIPGRNALLAHRSRNGVAETNGNGPRIRGDRGRDHGNGQGNRDGRGGNQPSTPGPQTGTDKGNGRNKGNGSGGKNGTGTAAGGQKPPATSQTGSGIKPYSKILQGTLNNNTQVSLSGGERTAIQRLANSQPLTQDDRSALSNLLFSGRPGLSEDELRAISFGLIEDQSRDRPAATAATVVSRSAGDRSPPPGAVRQDRRFLRVFNNSGAPVKLWVQYNVPDDQGGVWVPGDPDESDNALRYDLAPGKAYDLHHNGDRVAANRVRFWALSPTQTWSRNANTDLVLSSAGDEPDGAYFDTKVQTFTLTLSR